MRQDGEESNRRRLTKRVLLKEGKGLLCIIGPLKGKQNMVRRLQGTWKNQFCARRECEHSVGDASNKPFLDRSEASGTQENQAHRQTLSQGDNLICRRSD